MRFRIQSLFIVFGFIIILLSFIYSEEPEMNIDDNWMVQISTKSIRQWKIKQFKMKKLNVKNMFIVTVILSILVASEAQLNQSLPLRYLPNSPESQSHLIRFPGETASVFRRSAQPVYAVSYLLFFYWFFHFIFKFFSSENMSIPPCFQ